MRPGVKSKIMCILNFIQCGKICSLARSVNTQFYMYDMKNYKKHDDDDDDDDNLDGDDAYIQKIESRPRHLFRI